MKVLWQRHSRLGIAWALFILLFLLPRLPFFLAYPVVAFDNDDGGYYMLVDQMAKGFLPHLSIRPVGYPLFLKLVFSLSKRNFSVVAAQHLLTLLCGLGFIYSLYRLYGRYRWITFFISLALGIFASSAIHVRGDCTLMTDSLFVNLILLSLALLTLGLGLKRKPFLVLASTAMAGAILVRPAGLFLLLTYGLVVAFLSIGRFGRSALLSFTLPFACLLLALGIYNRLTIGTFAVSTFSEHALISFTSTFLEEDPSIGPVGNEAVRACRQAVDRKDIRILATSWKFWPLHRILGKYYENNRIRVARAFFDHEPADAFDLYLKWRPTWRKMGLNAIRSHPRIALKYLYANFMVYFFGNTGMDIDFYQSLSGDFLMSRSLREHFVGLGTPDSFFSRRFNTGSYAATLSPAFIEFMLKEYSHPPVFKHISLSAEGAVTLQPTPWKSLHIAWQKIHQPLFRNLFWIFLFLLSSLYSLYRLIITRMRHLGTFLFFLLNFSALAYGIFVVLSAFPYLRYSYPLEYVYYLCPVLIAISRLPSPENP